MAQQVPPCVPTFIPTATAPDGQPHGPPLHMPTSAATMPHIAQQPPHSMIPQPQSQFPPFSSPPQQPVDTATLPMMPPAIPTTSCAPSPRPGLQSGPLLTQHGTPPPSTHPGTSPQHSHNNPITHNPVPTTSTGPAAPYNFTTPSPPALAPQPAHDFSQSTTDNTTKAAAPPGPTQQPTPTTHTQQPNSSHTHRSRTPLSRHRRSRRSRQRRSSTPHNKRSTRRHSAPRRRRHRHNRSRSTRSRSTYTRRRLDSRPSIPSPRSRRGSRRRTPSPTSSLSPRTSPSPKPRIRLQPANILRQQFQRVALTMRAANAGPRRNPPPPPPPKAFKAPSQQHSHTHSDNPPQASSSQPFNVFSSPLPPCIEVRPAAEIPQDQKPTLHSYDIQDAERLIEKIREICGDSAVDGFTSDQLLAMSQMLHSAGYVPNDRGIEAIRWVEIDSLYPTLVISLHDPDLFEENRIPFRAPPPFGVTASEWQTNPAAVNCYTFVHGTSFQAGAEILREGLLRPTALPKGTRATASVVYGAATPGDISDYTVQAATAQLLKRPKGRNDIILLCTLATTEAHYKASWSSLTDEAHVCRRRGILRNSDSWGAHAGHLHVQGLIMVGHSR